jgi:hypothetical protein
MRSPFPGMDPYLERHWRDVHATVITLARAQLNRSLPEDLVARVEERVVIDPDPPARGRAIFRDVRVYEDPTDQPADRTPTAGGAAVAEPIILELEVEEHAGPYVTVIDADGGELVNVIEVLSPTNKLAGQGRDEYRAKRDKLLAARVNLVEIDLIRVGRWREALRPVVAPARAERAYRVVSWREHPVRRVELFPIGIRHRLPVIPIPLRDGDQDVTLDLQVLLDTVYVEGRYARLRYGDPCEPPLEGADADWADELLHTAGRR